ncbi:cbb3-type cytochrome oxidase assembly protein CcoS [Dongia sp.]|uniref:cbb3-type cytochrome oxidase assembly protein CcoS n=1 Tax=Dongia sp. TaxID=1977262 RepID=UPI0035B0D809
MTILLFLIPVALFLGGLGLAGFLWAMRSGQFDDLDGAAQRILFDDEPRPAVPRSRPETPPESAEHGLRS